MASYYEAWTKMMQDWLKLWGVNPSSGIPGGFGSRPDGRIVAVAPLVNTEMGDQIDVGNIHGAGVAIGGGAQARADGVAAQLGVVSASELAALTLQLKELTDQVARLTAQCGALDAHLAALLPARQEISEAELPA